jgi:hypothetical protein
VNLVHAVVDRYSSQSTVDLGRARAACSLEWEQAAVAWHESSLRERGVRRTSPAARMGGGGAEMDQRWGGVVGQRWRSLQECYGRGWSESRMEMGVGKDGGAPGRLLYGWGGYPGGQGGEMVGAGGGS